MTDEKRNPKTGCLCADGIEDEFVVENFLITHKHPIDFIKSQWLPAGAYIYTIYRVLITLGFLAWTPYDYWYNFEYVNNHEILPWLLFATNWTLLGLTLGAILHAWVTLYYTCSKKEIQGDQLPTSISIYWAIQIIFHNNSIVISVCFWTAILVLPHDTMDTSHVSKLKHSLAMAYVLIDTLLSGYPVHIFHLVYPMTAMLVYVAFNGIYFALGGEGPNHHNYVYYQLQWDHIGESVITIMLTMLMAIVGQFILFTVYYSRRILHQYCKCSGTKEENIPILEKK